MSVLSLMSKDITKAYDNKSVDWWHLAIRSTTPTLRKATHC